MERISFNSLKYFDFLDSFSPRNSGLLFSIFLHLIILLSAVGIPNIFGPKDVFVPNIVPIEILNISETTNIEKSENKNQLNKKITPKQKKFNSSENTEVQKQFEITKKSKIIDENNQSNITIKEKINPQIEQKSKVEIKQKEIIEKKDRIETIKTDNIKPKLKPQLEDKQKKEVSNSDLEIEPKDKKKEKKEIKENIKEEKKPKPKPKEDFNIASMLKDLRNETSNNVINNEQELEENKMQTADNQQNENMILSISEIDLLRQQLSSCWNAPAGAKINIGDKVTISAKVQQNMKVYQNSVRIVDTNISINNPFYGPITDSAMRTLLNPECTPLKLPEGKFNLWKNLTITFDYSIMKGN